MPIRFVAWMVFTLLSKGVGAKIICQHNGQAEIINSLSGMKLRWCKFWACIGWWVLSSSQCGHIINLRTLEHTENGNYQIWWCQLSKFTREYRVKSSYNLSFTLVCSRHYSNSQEATQYSYWIAFISSFKLLLAEKKLASNIEITSITQCI